LAVLKAGRVSSSRQKGVASLPAEGRQRVSSSAIGLHSMVLRSRLSSSLRSLLWRHVRCDAPRAAAALQSLFFFPFVNKKDLRSVTEAQVRFY
jgi:hypothetical protein